jgi:hypothetical protein
MTDSYRQDHPKKEGQMSKQFDHVVKEWEMEWKYLEFGKDRITPGKRFALVIGDYTLRQRMVNSSGRTYIGNDINKLSAGTKYKIIVNDAEDEVTVISSRILV